MNILCIFPVAPIHVEKVSEALKKFKENVAPKLALLGAIPEIKFACMDYTYVPTNQEIQGVPKGLGILDSIKNVSTVPDYIIACDGSLKIPPKYIVDISQQLVSDTSMHVVMGNRGENKAITPVRYLIERFEIYLLSRYFDNKTSIPDGQCGLWGYKNGKINTNGMTKEIILTSVGYEIELDLLSEALDKKLNYSFVDIQLPDSPSQSDFKIEDNFKKMNFLFNKYRKLNLSILEILKDFEETEEFRKLFEEGKSLEKFIEIWNFYKQEIIKMAKDFKNI